MSIIVDESHQYHDTDTGREYRSVTTILDSVGVKREIDGGSRWEAISGSFGKNCEVAANFGTAFHAFAGFDCRGIECEYDPAMQPWVDQYRAFRKAYPIGDVLACEEPMIHPIMGYAGTPDLVEYRGKVLWIWDWKTAAAFQAHWKLQLSAYRDLVILRYDLPRNTRFELRTVRFTDKKWFAPDKCNDAMSANQWRSVLNVYRMAA